MRMHASWFGSQRPTGYKVAARTPRAATASSPRTRHPDHTERAAVLGSIKARPGNDGACGQRRAMADLDSPCARRPPTHVGRGEETGFQVEQRNWYQGSGECREIVLDFESPIQGPNAMVRLLARVVGIGIETADMLVQEVLSRNMRD